MVRNYSNNHWFFFFVSSLATSFMGKNYRRKKISTSSRVLENLQVLGWKKNKRKMTLKMDSEYFIGPCHLPHLWNNSLQPTATKWNWSHSRLQEAMLMVPSHRPQKSPSYAGWWGTACQPFYLSFPASLCSVSLPGPVPYLFSLLPVWPFKIWSCHKIHYRSFRIKSKCWSIS